MEKKASPKILALITARGGSKGLPRKNILPLHGKPLIAWTIEAALSSKCITDCIVSSEDVEILEIARQWGAQTPFVRPRALGEDTSASIDVVIHALDWLLEAQKSYEMIMLLQPTSPLRTASDIDNAFACCCAAKAPCCVSVCAVEHSPYWTYTLDAADRLVPLLAGAKATYRQALPLTYRLNGALYLSNVEWIRKRRSFLSSETVGYIMPKERSVDIDDGVDFQLAAMLLAQQYAGSLR